MPDTNLQRVGEVRRYDLFTAAPAANTDVTIPLGLGTYWLALVVNTAALVATDTLSVFMNDSDGVLLDDVAFNIFNQNAGTIGVTLLLDSYQGYALICHPGSGSAAISAAIGPMPISIVKDLVVRWTAGTMIDGSAVKIELVAVRAV